MTGFVEGKAADCTHNLYSWRDSVLVTDPRTPKPLVGHQKLVMIEGEAGEDLLKRVVYPRSTGCGDAAISLDFEAQLGTIGLRHKEHRRNEEVVCLKA